MTPGREVAGVVDEVGADVDAGLVGERVVADLGLARGGTLNSRWAPWRPFTSSGVCLFLVLIVVKPSRPPQWAARLTSP
jgi:NADPH:quinone reductase-like Zn-dependent oxidoreductase